MTLTRSLNPHCDKTRKLLIFLAGKACLLPFLLACRGKLQVSESNVGLPCLPAATSLRQEINCATGA